MGIGYQDYNDPALQPPEWSDFMECDCCGLIFSESELNEFMECRECAKHNEEEFEESL